MRIVLLVIGLMVLAAIGAALHYYLPSRDIVRIVSTEVVREDFEAQGSGGTAVTRTRDVRQISAVFPDGTPSVYRNTDAPLYLKFDSADLTARAEDFVSSKEDPRWVVITHYGWRLPFFSAFPNALAIREAESVDESLFPWLNIIIIGVAIVLILVIRRFILIGVSRLTGTT